MPDDDGPKLPVMKADGTIENKPQPQQDPKPEPDAPIELNRWGPKKDGEWKEPAPYRPPPPPPRSRAVWIVVAATVLGVLLLGAALLFGGLGKGNYVRPNYLEKILPSRPIPPLVVDSEPAGATLAINGKVLGQTPWAGENQWSGENELVVTAPGFAPWRKKFIGRKELHFEVKLKPQ